MHCSNQRLLYSGYREWEILLAFLTFDPRLPRWLTSAKDVILCFNAFYRLFRAEVTARKKLFTSLCCILSLILRVRCDCGSKSFTHFLVFDGLRTPVTVQADILSSLILFCNWFFKRATAEADLVGSCWKYILLLISFVSCWRSTEIFLYFPLNISTLTLWATDCWSWCIRLV